MFDFGIVLVGVFVMNIVLLSDGATKIWLRDTDIRERENWVDGKIQEKCDGLVFPEEVDSVIWLDIFDAKEIVLPITGQIFLHRDQEDIVLSERSASVMNCVKLKEIQSYDWYDPSNWENPLLKNNIAVPHLERVPCRDKVVFPLAEYSGSITFSQYNHRTLPLTGFKWGVEHWITDDWNLYGQQGIMKEIFYDPPPIIISESSDDSTKRCYGIPSYIVCQHVEELEDYKCLDPVQPLGFCTKICGAHILLKPDVPLDDIKKILKAHSSYSDVHASEVRVGFEEYQQVVFTEKDFTGSSLDEANAFHHKLAKSAYLYGMFTVLGEEVVISIQKSGPFFVKGRALQEAIGITLGSLCLVIVLIGGLVYMYYSDFSANTLRNRIINGRPLSNVFATFSRDNVGLHYERHPSESSIHLPENFENPMYGKETPASSYSDVTATTTDEVPLQEVEKNKSKEDKDEKNENADEE
ncbi:unnamed protein product [Acanthoscelides obtectus]|uniref:Protein amnionless n=1 Tax=Acanthoscelides obtectus TaxID=200917 RepID=A0A9P0L036_ACAOB|nr:unnamed protein product [Acanthoscelides obtectus]CAK1659431.1 hypothetical protein AOBTE_LOCUS21451 [Acanthoscelides obtectus]